MIFLYHPKPYLVNPDAQVGLGLLCLATLARDLGFLVRIIDAQSWSEGKTIDMVPADETVLMSACLVDAPVVQRIGRRLKEKGCRVIIGGPIADGDTSFVSEFTDVVCVGLGEPLITSMACRFKPEKIYRRNRLANFDAYPIPDRSLLDKPGGSIFHPASGVATERSTTLLTARGCRYRCAFCTSGSSDVCHEYSIDRIGRELDQCVELGIRDVRISDDNLMASELRLKAVCRLLQEHGIRWRASVRTAPNRVGLYRLMAESGCVELSFGVESADPTVLRLLRKFCTVGDAHRALDNAKAAGIRNVRALMMMGTPGESPRTLELNKAFVEQHPDATFCLTVFYPFAGTAIAEDPERFGVRLEPCGNPNIYATRADGSEPEANVVIIGGMSKRQLTTALQAFCQYLKDQGQLNEG